MHYSIDFDEEIVTQGSHLSLFCFSSWYVSATVCDKGDVYRRGFTWELCIADGRGTGIIA
jgi:hypothetical protein